MEKQREVPKGGHTLASKDRNRTARVERRFEKG